MKIIIVKQGTIMKNFGNEIKIVMFSKAMIWREVVFMNWSDVYRKKNAERKKISNKYISRNLNTISVLSFYRWNLSCYVLEEKSFSHWTLHRGVATLGLSRHVPTHNFHKILRKIYIKWNVYIFLVFNVFFKNLK